MLYLHDPAFRTTHALHHNLALGIHQSLLSTVPFKNCIPLIHFPYPLLGIFFPQIPALPTILTSLTPQTHPGLLGICLSGAGPTILALATGNFDTIAEEIKRMFKVEGVEVDWEVLEVDERGSWVEEL